MVKICRSQNAVFLIINLMKRFIKQRAKDEIVKPSVFASGGFCVIITKSMIFCHF